MSYKLPVNHKTVEEFRGLALKMPSEKVESLLKAHAWAKSRLPQEDSLNLQSVVKFFLGDGEPEEMAQALKLINQEQGTLWGQGALQCLWWQQGEHYGELYLGSGEKDREKGSFPYQWVVLHFYTRHLDEIWIHLTRFKEGLELKFHGESNLAKRLFRAHWPQLHKTLAELGYEVHKVIYLQEKASSIFEIVDQKPKSYYSSIDFLA